MATDSNGKDEGNNTYPAINSKRWLQQQRQWMAMKMMATVSLSMTTSTMATTAATKRRRQRRHNNGGIDDCSSKDNGGGKGSSSGSRGSSGGDSGSSSSGQLLFHKEEEEEVGRRIYYSYVNLVHNQSFLPLAETQPQTIKTVTSLDLRCLLSPDLYGRIYVDYSPCSAILSPMKINRILLSVSYYVLYSKTHKKPSQNHPLWYYE